MKISEKQLTNIIMESVKSGLVEQKLKKAIKQMVRESLESFGGMSQFEAEDSESEPKELTKSDSGKADFNHENRDEEERRAQVEKFFSKDGVDIAPYAYKLYHVEAREGEDTNDMKNARSKFMKCLNHEPNEAGYPYSFSSSETNKLQSMISSNQLNEEYDWELMGKAKSVLPSKLIGIFINNVRNEIHFNGQEKYVKDFFKKYVGMYPKLSLKKLMNFAEYIERREHEVPPQDIPTSRIPDEENDYRGGLYEGKVKINESQLKNLVAESVKKVLAERYLEPGTADYDTDRIAQKLKHDYPQYEGFVDEYVYGGYYEPYTRMSGYRNSPSVGIENGFIEFIKSKQRG
jgi:hypothetical protein